MIVTDLTQRQSYALANPMDRSDNVPRQPHDGCTEIVGGKWRTIVEVSKQPGWDWLWMASVSRLRAPGGRAYKVGQWKPKWRDEADGLLRDLLAGVGGDDIDVTARARAEGHDPENIAGYHLWRPMTAAEVVLIGARSGAT